MFLSKNRWIIVSACHYIALFFAAQLNFYLTATGVQVFVLGMLISFSAIELNYNQGLLSVLPIGLILDSKSPLGFGLISLLAIAIFTFGHLLRSKVRREIALSTLAVSTLLNLLAFFGMTIAAATHYSSTAVHAWPLAVNLCANTLLVLALNRTYFDIQTRMLKICGIDLAEEQREAR